MSSCLYCQRSIPPSTPSIEHVLWDSFGGTLTLPDDAVCLDCNNFLAHDVDTPTYLLFSSVLRRLEIRGAKGHLPAGATVKAPVDSGPLQGAEIELVQEAGSFNWVHAARRLVVDRVRNGRREKIFIVGGDKDRRRLQADLSKKYPGSPNLQDIGPPPAPKEDPVGSSPEADAETLLRGVVSSRKSVRSDSGNSVRSAKRTRRNERKA